jgi:hypothetical protein
MGGVPASRAKGQGGGEQDKQDLQDVFPTILFIPSILSKFMLWTRLIAWDKKCNVSGAIPIR